MNRRVLILLALFVLVLPVAAAPETRRDSLQQTLSDYVKSKDATIGIAVITDSGDTIAVNGDRPFPMLSVYKLPIVLAYGAERGGGEESLAERVTLTADDLKPDTYSPMRDRYAGRDSVSVMMDEVVAYALQQSDNNASDIILRSMGGAANVNPILERMGFSGISVIDPEEDMHRSQELCCRNSSTPLAMARMVERLDNELDGGFFRRIKSMMETCETGRNRLYKPLEDTGAVLGHKTGTGFTLADGRLMAVNDAGYVHLPDGRSYYIVVFIENSGYDMEQTENLIAEISAIVKQYMVDECLTR